MLIGWTAGNMAVAQHVAMRQVCRRRLVELEAASAWRRSRSRSRSQSRHALWRRVVLSSVSTATNRIE